MAKERNVYFGRIEEQIGCCLEASRLLSESLLHYAEGRSSDRGEKMRGIEHRSDMLRRDTAACLAKEFITPIDREDILDLVQIADGITHGIGESFGCFFAVRPERVPGGASTMAEAVERCISALAETAGELYHFKRSENLAERMDGIRDRVRKSGAAYTEALRSLFVSASSAKELAGMKAVYDGLKHCCNLCGYAADRIEQIVLKNT